MTSTDHPLEGTDFQIQSFGSSAFIGQCNTCGWLSRPATRMTGGTARRTLSSEMVAHVYNHWTDEAVARNNVRMGGVR